MNVCWDTKFQRRPVQKASIISHDLPGRDTYPNLSWHLQAPPPSKDIEILLHCFRGWIMKYHACTHFHLGFFVGLFVACLEFFCLVLKGSSSFPPYCEEFQSSPPGWSGQQSQQKSKKQPISTISHVTKHTRKVSPSYWIIYLWIFPAEAPNKQSSLCLFWVPQTQILCT